MGNKKTNIAQAYHALKWALEKNTTNPSKQHLKDVIFWANKVAACAANLKEKL